MVLLVIAEFPVVGIIPTVRGMLNNDRNFTNPRSISRTIIRPILKLETIPIYINRREFHPFARKE